jgi:hypothetical protein
MQHFTTGLRQHSASTAQVGHVLLAPFGSNAAFLINPAGEVTHRWTTGHGLTHFCYLLPNGNLFANEMCTNPKGVPLTTSGLMRERDHTSAIVWEHLDPYQHHDARRLPEGGAIYIAYTDPKPATNALFPSGVPGSELPEGMYGECLREVNEAGEIVWEWHTDALPHELRRMHRNANRWSAGHLNTLQPLGDNTVLVCSKSLNMTFLLRRGTGELLWHFKDDELGGPHDAQQIENGNVLIFANGVYASDLHHSQVWEINPATNEVVWRYVEKNNPMQFYSPHIGGVQRLPGGNTLICEGAHGNLFEVTPEGDIVWNYVNPVKGFHAKFGHVNWLFRVRSYDQNNSALHGLT